MGCDDSEEINIKKYYETLQVSRLKIRFYSINSDLYVMDPPD